MLRGLRKSSQVLQKVAIAAAAVIAAAPAFSADYPPYRFVCASGHPLRQYQADSCGTKPATSPLGRDVAAPERLAEGYTVVLPGVLGTTPYNTKLIRLLKEAPTAVDYFDWTRGTPLFSRRGLGEQHPNSAAANTLTQRISQYQDLYPGRPVHIVALCAGAGVACETLAQLGPERAIDSVILLGPALSPSYDLRPALLGTKNGIDSFHSPLDVPVLVALTTVVGTVDGQHMPAAGAIGFIGFRKDLPDLRQHMYNPKMLIQGHYGGHFGWTASRFVDENLIPIIAGKDTIRAASN